MSVSSVSSATPIIPVQTSIPPQPQVQTGSSTADSATTQPTPPPPLPPGQGTRVDQLV
jgi:hypothetical protein